MRILTGLQPSGTAHIGNYFGGIQPTLEMQNQGEVFLDDTPKKVFSHQKELEEIGLAVPTVTEIMARCKKAGLEVDASVTTLEEAKTELLRLYQTRHVQSR